MPNMRKITVYLQELARILEGMTESEQLKYCISLVQKAFDVNISRLTVLAEKSPAFQYHLKIERSLLVLIQGGRIDRYNDQFMIMQYRRDKFVPYETLDAEEFDIFIKSLECYGFMITDPKTGSRSLHLDLARIKITLASQREMHENLDQPLWRTYFRDHPES